MNLRRSLLIGTLAAATLGLVPAGMAVASTHSASSTRIKFVATETAAHFNSTKTAFEEVGRDTHKGKVLGYYTLSCQLTSSTTATCGGGGSFVKGMIYFTFPLKMTSKTFSGTVTGGTGAYSGATGKIYGKTITSKKESVTIVLT
jgi:hypothetical protein